MEEKQEKDINDTSIFRGDFADFEDDNEMLVPEMDEDIVVQDEATKQEYVQVGEHKYSAEEIIEEEKKETQTQEIEEVKEENVAQNVSPWEQFEEENPAVKKYLFYVSKDFVSHLDNLTTDERSAYINDAIQKKIDIEAQQKKIDTKKRITIHFVIMIITIILSSPIALWICHKAIIATFDNYKYSQENFEKLYKERFSKDRAYMRSIQYNKEQEIKSKKH